MTRIARDVVPGLPHHVTQRGNRRERVFFEEADYALYRDWLGESCRRFGVEIWAYCQMPNHVHLILTPEDGEGLALALSRAHRLYAGFVNARARRRARPRSAAHRPCAAFRRLARKRSRRRRLCPLETERADRSTARLGGLCGGDREAPRASACAGQTRPQAAKPGRRGSIRIKTGVSPYSIFAIRIKTGVSPYSRLIASQPYSRPSENVVLAFTGCSNGIDALNPVVVDGDNKEMS